MRHKPFTGGSQHPQDAEHALYETMRDSEFLRGVGRSFHDATGLTLRLVPGGDRQGAGASCSQANPFCALMAANPTACAACGSVQDVLRGRLSEDLSPQEASCFAGLTDVAVPVMVHRRHVGTLLAGQVFRRKPDRRHFTRLARRLQEWGMRAELRRIREAYDRTPALSARRFRGAVRLLEIIAAQLATISQQRLLASSQEDPPPVSGAKAFIRAHADKRVSVGQTAAHVHLSRCYFCKVFKRATGMTFTQYLTCVRVEHAQELLSDSAARVTDVALHAGFTSLSQFHRAFRRTTGMSPTAYRDSRRAGGSA